jgi:hypothetical protein
MSETTEEPLLVGLAPLPREQIGPFLLLGLEKDADGEEIEAHWAQRVIGARRQQAPASLTDINWAREVLNDATQRLRADAASLNTDTCGRLVARLATRFGLEGSTGPLWEPLDSERPPDETNAPAIPDPAAIRAGMVLPDVPPTAPAAATLLEQWLGEPLDPWAVDLSSQTSTEDGSP